GTNVIVVSTTNYVGSASFGYVVQDNGTTAGTNDFKTAVGPASFTIFEVNDPPGRASTQWSRVAEDSSPRVIPRSVVLSKDTPGPANESGQILTLIAVSNVVGG